MSQVHIKCIIINTCTNISFPHLPAQEAAVPELPEEEGDEEGPHHEDQGQQGRVGLVQDLGLVLCLVLWTCARLGAKPRGHLGGANGVALHQGVLLEHLPS